MILVSSDWVLRFNTLHSTDFAFFKYVAYRLFNKQVANTYPHHDIFDLNHFFF